jgi:MFS family permease
VHQAYLAHSTVGFMTYGVGAATAFIAVTLGLSDAQAGLHASAVAVGLIIAGTSGERLDGRFGERIVHFSALALLAVGVLLLGTAPALPFTLAGAIAVGAGNGLLLVFVNRTVTDGGGALARTQLARSTLVSMTSALTASLVVGIGVASGVGWQVFVMPALVLVGIGAITARTRSGRGPGGSTPTARLPRDYWMAWLLVGLVVAIEFSVVFWASAIVQARSGVPLEEAAFVLSAFVLGIVIGRTVLSVSAVSGLEPMGMFRGGVVLVGAGAVAAWLSPSLPVSGLAFVIGGIGLGILFPLAATTAFALAPGQAHQASARIVLSVGLAMLTAPLALGVAGDAFGLLRAWVLVPILCVLALALSVPVARRLRASLEV